MRSLLTFAAAVFAGGSLAEAADTLPSLLEKTRKEHSVPAMAAAVVDSDGLIDASAVGDRQRGGREGVLLSDRFAIGSCTKSMTATLAAKLIEDGVLSGDTTLADVWPDGISVGNRKVTIHERLKTVTLDDLLGHTSGLQGDLPTDSSEWNTFFTDSAEPRESRLRILSLVLAEPPQETQGKYSYSNLGYVIVAAMIETKAEDSYEALLRRHVLEPLGMVSAVFHAERPTGQGGLHVSGHRESKPVPPNTIGAENPPAYSPAGTLWLSVLDWSKYARWHLAGDPSPVLETQAAYDRLHEKQSDGDAGPYGQGWILPKTPSGTAYTHGGSNTSFFALIWVLPKQDVAVVVMANRGLDAFPACDAVAGQLLRKHAKAPRK